MAWLVLTCSACEREPSPTSAAPSTSASVKRATASAVLSAPRAGAPSREPNAVHDLLRQSDVQVTVSSLRDRKSVGEFLADGRSDTAWRPNPPDPAPWVEVVVPASARVHEVRLALEASPLLEGLRVHVSRNGKEWARAGKGAAELRFSAPGRESGGTFRVTFEGSGRAAGRSVAVTTLTFGGDAGGKLGEAAPAVTVKGAGHALGEPFVSWGRDAPYSTRDVLCERYHELRAAMPRQREDVDAGGDDATSAATLAAISCAASGDVTKGDVACERTLIAYGDAHAQASMWMLSEDAKALWAPPRAWVWERDYALSPSGRLRVGSCREGGQAKGTTVACYATLSP